MLFFVIYGSIALLWTGYRVMFFLPEWVDEFVAKPLIWLLPLLFVKNSLKHPSSSITPHPFWTQIGFGLAAGCIYFILFTFLTRFTVGFPLFNPDKYTFVQIILQGAIALSTGFVEEFVFRRYLLEEIYKITQDDVIANAVCSILFAFIHIPIIVFIYKYPIGQAVSYLSLLTISGFIYGVVYLKNRSVLSSTMTHAVWNFLGTLIH